MYLASDPIRNVRCVHPCADIEYWQKSKVFFCSSYVAVCVVCAFRLMRYAFLEGQLQMHVRIRIYMARAINNYNQLVLL